MDGVLVPGDEVNTRPRLLPLNATIFVAAEECAVRGCNMLCMVVWVATDTLLPALLASVMMSFREGVTLLTNVSGTLWSFGGGRRGSFGWH